MERPPWFHTYVVVYNYNEDLKVTFAAKSYPYIFIFGTILVWLAVQKIVSVNAFELLKYQPQTVTLLLLLFIPVFDTIIRTAVNYVIPPMSGSGEVALKAHLS